MTGSPLKTSLYLHIPFCTRKCPYCHFYVIPEKKQTKELLLEGLLLEWQQQSRQNISLETIYFGGGTPTLFGASAMQPLLETFGQTVPLSSIEVTIEANPEDVTLPLMQAYKQLGINRVSIGIQSFDDTLLQAIGRTHNAEKAKQAVLITKKAGIDNISIDLMYDLPGQTLSSWMHSLSIATELPITHLSLYNLTIEPHTPFFRKKEQIAQIQPSPETSTQMYLKAIETLENHGLFRYELSAFAKEGKRSHHNSGYWTGRPFLGLGPSAWSYWNHTRLQNIPSLHKWHSALTEGLSPITQRETLPPEQRQKELLILLLRLKEGVYLPTFEEKEGPLSQETHTQLKQLQERGWLTKKEKRIALTKQGVLFYDTLASELI